MIGKLRNPPRLLMAALLLGIAQPALAGVFCVDTAWGLQNALSTAAANAQDDEVQIIQGTYVGNFVYASNQANKLSVLGGFTAGCAGRTLDPVNTILDGNFAGRVLSLSTLNLKSTFVMQGMTIRHGSTGMNHNGGGIYAVNNGSISMSDNYIVGNKATTWYEDSGGGVYLESENTIIVNSLIESNEASYDAGGLYVVGSSIIEHNHITGNKTVLGNGGGGYLEGDTVVKYNIIDKNYAESIGGGLYIAGENAKVLINIVFDNAVHDFLISYYGGGVYLEVENGFCVNNTIYSNSAGYGGGLTIGGNGNYQLYNNIILDNGKADLYVKNNAVTLNVDAYNNNITSYTSDHFIPLDPSNININPLFADAKNRDFRLKEGSPMIDAGSDEAPYLPATDFAGIPRTLGQSVDIGAYEFNDGSFFDVSSSSWAYDYIYAIRDAGITGGCGGGNYCPQGLVTREQMAAFLVRAVEGEPAANYCGGSSYFSDVAPDAWSCGYIKRLSELNITGGCGGGNYCPQGLVTRDQMAAFIVRAVAGEPALDYCGDVAPFQDVAPSSFFCRYIKRLAELNVTQGCGDGNYCPYDTVNREQMAAFLARAFLDME